MAVGDKKAVVMEADRAIANGIATLDENKNVPFDQLGNVTRPNLLDNWYFGNPIDQRQGWIVPPGKTYYITGDEVGGVTDKYYNATLVRESDTYSYWSINVDGVTRYVTYADAVRGYTGAGYTIDRWFLIPSGMDGSGCILINDDGITLKTLSGIPYFCYPIGDFIRGKTVTISVLLADGRFFTNTGYVPESGVVDGIARFYPGDGIILDITEVSYNICLRFFSGEVSSNTYKAIKLELGTQQTLAHQDADGNWVLNEIPNYNEELLKCCMSTVDSTDTYANNKMTPAAINAVNKAGDTMTGALKVSNGNIVIEGSENGSTVWFKKHDDLSNAAFITQYHDLETKNSLKFGRYQEGVLLGQWDILHTLNKPSGSYTGNGSATERTIEINGIGSVLILSGPGSTAIVSNAGAFIFTYQGTTIILPPENMKFINGILTIATDNQWVNTNTYGYGYQVL